MTRRQTISTLQDNALGIPVEWLKLLYRLMGLPSGRHMVTLDTDGGTVLSITVTRLGKIESIKRSAVDQSQ